MTLDFSKNRKFMYTSSDCDTGYQGLQKHHVKTHMPKKNPLTMEDKIRNQTLSKKQLANYNVVGILKRFKITSNQHRNRRKIFSLLFNLIAEVYNLELTQ